MKNIIEIRNYINSRILKDNNIGEIAYLVYLNINKRCKEVGLVLINVFKDDAKKNELVIIAYPKGSSVLSNKEIPVSGGGFEKGVSDALREGGYFYEVGDFAVNKDLYYDGKGKNNYKTLIAFPININNVFRGSLEIFTEEEVTFPKKEINYFSSIASALSGALDHYIVFAKQKKADELFESSFSNIIELLVSLIEIKDKYTSGHSSNVKDVSMLISRELGLDKKEIGEIRFAANLHDIGKIAVSENILNKPSKLTNKEFEDIKRHPVQGAFILANIPQLKNIGNLILHHHERFDGEGYPVGLSGLKIPLGSRIIAVADAFDAMTSKRPYRDEMKKQDAIDIIKKESGLQFDPEIVNAFLKIAPEITGKSRSLLEGIIEKDIED